MFSAQILSGLNVPVLPVRTRASILQVVWTMRKCLRAVATCFCACFESNVDGRNDGGTS